MLPWAIAFQRTSGVLRDLQLRDEYSSFRVWVWIYAMAVCELIPSISSRRPPDYLAILAARASGRRVQLLRHGSRVNGRHETVANTMSDIAAFEKLARLTVSD